MNRIRETSRTVLDSNTFQLKSKRIWNERIESLALKCDCLTIHVFIKFNQVCTLSLQNVVHRNKCAFFKYNCQNLMSIRQTYSKVQTLDYILKDIIFTQRKAVTCSESNDKAIDRLNFFNTHLTE